MLTWTSSFQTDNFDVTSQMPGDWSDWLSHDVTQIDGARIAEVQFSGVLYSTGGLPDAQVQFTYGPESNPFYLQFPNVIVRDIPTGGQYFQTGWLEVDLGTGFDFHGRVEALNAGSPIDFDYWTASAVIEIDQPPLSIGRVYGANTWAEGGSAVFRVSIDDDDIDLSQASLSQDVVFTWVIRNGSTSNSDFDSPMTGTGRISSVTGYADITVDFAHDGVIDDYEDFTFEIIGFGDPSRNAEIYNADRTVSVSNDTVTEGGTARLRVELEGGPASFITNSSLPDQSVTIAYQINDLTATGGQDHATPIFGVGTVTIAPGQQYAYIDIPTVEDSTFEGTEAFEVELLGISGSPVNVTLDDSIGIVTILDDDPEISVSLSDLTLTEGQTGHITVTLSQAAQTDVHLDLSIPAGGDLVLTSEGLDADGRIAFAAGQTSVQVGVMANADGLAEGTENLTIAITGSDFGAELSGATSTVTVDDGAVMETVRSNLPFTLPETSVLDLMAADGTLPHWLGGLDGRYELPIFTDLAFDAAGDMGVAGVLGTTAELEGQISGTASLAAFIDTPGLGSLGLTYPVELEVSYPQDITDGGMIETHFVGHGAVDFFGTTVSMGDIGLSADILIEAGSGLTGFNIGNIPNTDISAASYDLDMLLDSDLHFDADLVSLSMLREWLQISGTVTGGNGTTNDDPMTLLGFDVGALHFGLPDGERLDGTAAQASDQLDSASSDTRQTLMGMDLSVLETLGLLTSLAPGAGTAIGQVIGLLNHSISTPDFGTGFGLSASYSFVDLILSGAVELVQSFEFTPAEITYTASYDGQDIGTGTVGQDMDLTGLSGLSGLAPDQALQLDFGLSGSISTTISLVVSAGYSAQAISGGASVGFDLSGRDPAPGSTGATLGGGFGFGPLFEQGGSVDLVSIDLLSQSFDVTLPGVTQSYGGNAASPFLSVPAVTQLTEGTALLDLTVTRSDPFGGAVPGLSLGGPDAHLFSIDPSGLIAFNNAPDYETDPHVYSLTVIATNALGFSTSAPLTVELLNDPADDPPSEEPNVAPRLSYVSDQILPEGYAAGDPLIAVATSDPNGDAVSLTLEGPDAALFSIGVGGLISLNITPDFEIPADANGDNSYQLTLVATDPAGLQTRQSVQVHVADQDEAPQITGPDSLTMREGETGPLQSFTATDPEGGPVYFALQGADAAMFSVDGSGQIALRQPLDFETPQDADGNNRYNVTLVAYDAEGNATQMALRLRLRDNQADNTLPPEVPDLRSGLIEEDSANTAPWAARIDLLAPDGSLAERLITFDNGDLHRTVFGPDGQRDQVAFLDLSNTRGLTRWDNFFEANGALSQRQFTYDSGHVTTLRYAGGVKTERQDIEADGDIRTLTFGADGQADSFTFIDASNSRPLAGQYDLFGTDGTVQQRLYTYDDGRSLALHYADGQLSSRTETEADGDTRHSLYGPEGTRSSFTFTDVSNSRAWTSYTDTFDSDGQLISRSFIWDAA